MRDYTPEELLALPDDRFRKVVEDDARSTSTVASPATPPRVTAATAAALRDELVIERFHQELLVLHRGVEGRLATKKAYFESLRFEMLGGNPGEPSAEYLQAKAAYAQGRADALRFKTCVDQALVNVKGIRRVRADRARRLEAGIRSWWAAFAASDVEPSEDDHELWRLMAAK